MTLPATVGTPVPLAMILEDGNTTQFPQAEVYAQASSSPLAVIDLVHRARGRYEANWTPASVGTYSAVFLVYADNGHMIENIVYTREIEQVFVSQTGIDDLAAQVVRILGLVHENAFIDNTVHDALGSLVAARIRIFDSKINVELATNGGSETTGLIATYEIETTYEADCRMGTYRVKKVS
jgi:hypothetical protein